MSSTPCKEKYPDANATVATLSRSLMLAPGKIPTRAPIIDLMKKLSNSKVSSSSA
ncbi:unannotated protein [freshwater metagenome]|uniref:Unannotated protein n=1 Tax=freshwater metagenome TaxID=449393 RepID=A0A6J6CVU3_9ZZZZ